jgi:catechol 2,3-dioxygenase-like lactoylglutathione lyase family enzyme
MPGASSGSGTMFNEEPSEMPNFSFVLLYVENPPASATFYAELLGRPVIESSATFAMLPLSEGVMLGLWSRKTVEPAAAAQPGAGEVAFTVDDVATVEATFVIGRSAA